MKRLVVCCLFAAVCHAQETQVFIDSTERFLGQLDEAQSAEARYPFDSDAREDWHFVPKVRDGVNFHHLGSDKEEHLLTLLKTILSERGFEQIEKIRSLESVLWEMQGQRGTRRDPGDYYLAVFGVPGPSAPWGLRYEGHHLSLNWTFLNGKVVSSSPQFLGANPATVPIGESAGFRALASTEDIPRKLLSMLSAAQVQTAVIGDVAPPDILTFADRVAAIQENRGLKYGDLTPEQQSILMAIITEYVSIHIPSVAEHRMDRVKEGGMDELTFAWMGSTEVGEGHYYRIQGPKFLIEYDNTQNNANHIHTVWRDFDGDFGRDVLKEHYASAPAHHGHDRAAAHVHIAGSAPAPGGHWHGGIYHVHDDDDHAHWHHHAHSHE